MLNQLKRWILTRANASPVRRCIRLPHFRGQIEQLETRSLLSASWGAMPENVETGAIAAVSTFDGPVASHFEDPRSNGDWLSGPVQRGRSAWVSPLPDVNLSTTNYVIIVWRYDPRYHYSANAFAGVEGMPSGLPGKTPTLNNGAIAATGAMGGTYDNSSNEGPLKSRAPYNESGAISNLLPVPWTTTSTASTPSKTARGARDAVFQAYSSESLLLAVSVDEWREIDSDRFDGEMRKPADDEQGIFVGLSDSSLQHDVTVSLDALRRERAAIDEVLAELHDVQIDHETSSKSAQESQRSNATIELTPSYERALATARDVLHSQSSAEGGMVLLEASGDANSSAYDLTAIILGAAEHGADEALGMEASVGIYQAIDVGTSDLRPTGEQVGQSVPSTTPRPSTSAENAPGKKGGQPS